MDLSCSKTESDAAVSEAEDAEGRLEGAGPERGGFHRSRLFGERRRGKGMTIRIDRDDGLDIGEERSDDDSVRIDIHVGAGAGFLRNRGFRTSASRGGLGRRHGNVAIRGRFAREAGAEIGGDGLCQRERHDQEGRLHRFSV
jgi:hypothetical protein